MLAAKFDDDIQIDWITESMRKHHCARLRAQSRFKLRDVYTVSRKIDINEHWDTVILQNWIDCRGKSSGNRNHFVAGFEFAIADQFRRQRGYGQ